MHTPGAPVAEAAGRQCFGKMHTIGMVSLGAGVVPHSGSVYIYLALPQEKKKLTKLHLVPYGLVMSENVHLHN